MKKIRINELARELEVKAHEILDRLPELGVQEKKTHSSSIDEDVAIKLRRLYGFTGSEDDSEASANGGGSPRTWRRPTRAPTKRNRRLAVRLRPPGSPSHPPDPRRSPLKRPPSPRPRNPRRLTHLRPRPFARR